MMNELEAINELQEDIELTMNLRKNSGIDGKSSGVLAMEMAIKSLEMQIPKKPIYSDFDDNGNDEIIPYKAVCPVCGHEFEFGKWNDEENHHCRCGQKIDWEGCAK